MSTNKISEDKQKLEMYRCQLKTLLEIPKLQQKTTEWYQARNNLITASDFAQALGAGKFGSQRQLIEKKVDCVLYPDADAKPLKNMFFDWGNLFEPVACDVYADMHGGVKVHEFGLIVHPHEDYFGASPDGITDDGVMLEIKCPLKRKITEGGEIPEQYYYQIQGQLEVCGLEQCDYFECEFQKYTSYEEYVSAYDNESYTGVIIDATEKTYPVLQKGKVCNLYDDDHAVYWVLKAFNLKRVTKDAEFVNIKLAELKKVWEKILRYRNDPSAYTMEVKKKISINTSSLKASAKSNSSTNTKYMIVDLD
jgi:putative phage-type endonuclease